MASDIQILKAVEYSKLSAKFRKLHTEDEITSASGGWWLQAKYDGCFGIVKNGKMYSRTGELVQSCDHIVKEVESKLRDSGADPAYHAVIGEVWHQDKSFAEISGQFRRHSAAPDLQFVVNDIVDASLIDSNPYKVRHRRLLNVFGYGRQFPVAVARTYRAGEWGGDARDFAKHWKEHGGFDGAILRDPDSTYEIGLASQGQIIKVKPIVSYDLEVIGTEPGVGKHAGRIGALVVRYRGGAALRVGTGLSDADRERTDWVGKIVEVAAMGDSEDGLLREPRLRGERTDKEHPDF